MDETPTIALISAVSTALGVLGTLVYSYFNGKAGLDQQIDRRVEMILEQYDLALKRKDGEIKDRDRKIQDRDQKIEDRDSRIEHLEEENCALRIEVDDLKGRMEKLEKQVKG